MILVDEVDNDLLQYTWAIHSDGYPRAFVNGSMRRLHKLVAERMGLNGLIDHKNGNKADCRRSNLRLSTRSRNSLNMGRPRGVSWCNKRKKYIAKIRVDKKNYYLGQFDNADDAYEVYESKYRELVGENPRGT